MGAIATVGRLDWVVRLVKVRGRCQRAEKALERWLEVRVADDGSVLGEGIYPSLYTFSEKTVSSVMWKEPKGHSMVYYCLKADLTEVGTWSIT